MGLQHSGTWDFSAVTDWKNNMLLVGPQAYNPPAPWADASSIGPENLLAQSACVHLHARFSSHPRNPRKRAVLGIEPRSSHGAVPLDQTANLMCLHWPPGGRSAMFERSVEANKPDLALWKSDAPFKAKFCPVKTLLERAFTIPGSMGRWLFHWATGPLGKGWLHSSHSTIFQSAVLGIEPNSTHRVMPRDQTATWCGDPGTH